MKFIFELMRRKGELARFAKFCAVGGSGVGVNEGLLWVLRQFAGLPIVVSNAVGIEVSILSNFVLNDFITFSDRRSPGTAHFIKRLGKFNLICAPGWGINTVTTWSLSHYLGDRYYLLFNLVGIALAVLWNYLANSWWTWRR